MIKKTLSILILISLLASNLTVFAATEKTQNPIPTRDYKEATSPEGGAATDFFACSVSGILANALKLGITELLSKTVGLLTGFIDIKVPTSNSVIEGKDAALTIFGYPILPSWDSMGYCLANATIAYISDATIYWIRSGFKGNPTFVENPEKFFRQIVDLEYEDFLDNVAAELACDPFKVNITNNLSKTYNKKFKTRGKCSLYDSDGDVDGFLSGDSFDFNVWYNYTQNDANNPIASTLQMQKEMEERMKSKKNSIEIELNWGKGFLPWKNKDGKTVSPGTAISTQVEKTLNIPKDRLILADEFDEVIDELVNYLVKYAMDESISAINEI